MTKKKDKSEKIERIIELMKEENLDKALELADVNDVEDLLGIGAMFEQNEVHDVAEKIFDRVVQLNPNYAEAWSNKGVGLVNLGKNEEAIKCFEEALKLNPNYAMAWFDKGLALGNLGRNEEAIKCFEEALKLNPNYAEAWADKGLALLNLGEYDEAVKCFNEAIKINPNNAKAWYNMGVALVNLRDNNEAVKCYDEAIKINPDVAAAWSNKGIALGNLGKYDEAVKCYDEAIKINPSYAEAYGNKGITLINTRKYDKAKAELRKAKNLFSKKRSKEDADRAHKYELLAVNGSELMAKLKPLDKQFINSLNSMSLTELEEKSLRISEDVEGVIREFEKREIPEDAIHLLVSKAICFTVLSSALKFEKVDLKELENTKKVFEKWGFVTFVIAVNSLDTFIRWVNRYNNLKEIPKGEEEFLLRMLSTSYVLDGKLTEEISGKIKGEPYAAKPTSIGIEKEPKIIYKHITNTEKEWVRFCLVQLDYSLEYQRLPEEFGYILNERDKIRKKVFKAFEIAAENKVDVICFPELCFAKDWVQEIINQYRDMIIIGGSYYDDGYNVCPIIINGEYIDPPYKKIQPSPLENPEATGRGMRSGKILYIFQTKCGRFSILTCSDYMPQNVDSICRYDAYGRKGVDFIINPRYEKSIFRFQSRCNSDCEDYGIDVIQVNKSEEGEDYGKSCIIGKEHTIILDRLIKDKFKTEDDIKYKLFQLDGETMIIAELNIRMKAPPVSLPIKYSGRIRLSKEKCYKCENGLWLPLSNQ